MSRDFPPALHAVTRASAVPYGYTITVWCSGASLMHRHGPPAAAHVFLFLLGAVVAFGALSLPASAVANEPLEASTQAHVLTGVLNVAAAAAGVGAAELLSGWDSGAVWPLTSFAATALYLLLAAAGLTLASSVR